MGGVTVNEAFPTVRKAQPTKWLRYDNSDKALFPTFFMKLKNHVKNEAESIGTEVDQVWFVFNSLDGDAGLQLQPWMSLASKRPAEGALDNFSLEGIYAQLARTFEDPRAADRAMDKLNSLRQGSRSMRDFFTIFERLLLEAGGWEWTDRQKKRLLRTAISSEIRDRLVAVREEDKYEDFVEQIRECIDRLAELKDDNKRSSHQYYRDGNNGSFGQVQKPKLAKNPDVMEWEATIAAAKVASAKLAVAHGGQSYNRGSGKKRAKWVDRATYQARKDSDLCLRCGGDGHRVASCPFARAQKPAGLVASVGKATKVPIKVSVEPALESSDDESDNDSEN